MQNNVTPIFSVSSLSSQRASVALVSLLATAMCSSSHAFIDKLFGPPVKEFTGTVLDADTKEPIEGAFVMASYSVIRSGLAATIAQCVKTRSMITGKDGTYRFPTADLNGMPPQVDAIKLDYILAGGRTPRAWNNNSHSKDAYQGWDVLLKKQTPENPQRGFIPKSFCEYAKTAEDGAASVYFMRLDLVNREKYWPAESWPASKSIQADIQMRIRELEGLPSAAGSLGKNR